LQLSSIARDRLDTSAVLCSRFMADRAQVHVLPPFVQVGMLATGVLLRLAFPAPFLPTAVATLTGAVVIAGSITLVVLAARELRKSRTAFDVRRPTTMLVSTGPFRVSRNPVYFAMLLLQLGLGLILNSPWMVALVIPMGSALCLAVIRPEERYLEEKFGAAYRSYQLRVGRWLRLRAMRQPAA
jgi:protein-S-isoprenylcysteine O-methyltransferase Ste14